MVAAKGLLWNRCVDNPGLVLAAAAGFVLRRILLSTVRLSASESYLQNRNPAQNLTLQGKILEDLVKFRPQAGILPSKVRLF